jgi:hypothetical protein
MVIEDPIGENLPRPSSRFRIVTNRILRNESIERSIIEMNRSRMMYALMVAGGVLLVVAMAW